MRGTEQITDYPHSTAVTQEEVEVQLGRILSSDIFSDTPRLKDFLRYVVDETLQGRADHIKGFTIALEVFQRVDHEDAQTTAIVRVEAGRLRRRLDDYYLNEGQQDPIRIRIPKGAYVPSFEPVPVEDVKNQSAPNASTDSRRRFQFHALNMVMIAILFVMIMAALWWTLLPSRDQQRDTSGRGTGTSEVAMLARPAIAILPFEDSTQDATGALLAKGLTEEIITDLSKVSGIDVIALSSVLPYKNKTVDPRQTADELKVSHILRGTIQGSSKEFHITAQLYEIKTGKETWAKRFDLKPENILALQDELAIKIIEGMSVRLQDNERQRLGNKFTNNQEAYALYKQAMHLVNPPSDPGRLKVARRAFEKVIEADPGFVGGYAGIAYTYAFDAWWGHSQSPEMDIQNAVDFTQKAANIDPSFGLTYSALAFTHLAQQDFDKALTSSQKAIKAEPNDPYVMAYHGFLLCANGEPELGIDFAKRALRLDPLYPRTPFLNILGLIYFQAGMYQKALDAFQRNIDRGGPSNPGIQAYIVATYAMLKRNEEAKATLELLSLYKNGFNWREWIRSSFKHERDVEKVLQPIDELNVK